MRTSFSRPSVAVVALVGALASCGPPKVPGDGSNPPVGTGATQTKKVTAAQGGEVAVDGAKLTVPPGAVPADTDISVTSTTEPAPETYKPLSPLYKFGPEGLEFAQPAEIALPAPATGADKAVIYWSKKGGTGFDVLATRVVGNELHAFVTHFSMGFCGDAAAGQQAGASVVTSCGVPSSGPDCAGCSITCEGDTQAYCGGAGSKNCDPNGGNCQTTCATPTCECRPIPHTCSVPANDACHQAGCSVTCSGEAPLAICSQSGSNDSGSVPDAGIGGGGSGGTGGGTGTCTCADGSPCDAQGGCAKSCGPAPTCSCVSIANSGGSSGGPDADGGIPTTKCASDADCPTGGTCVNGACGVSSGGGCGPNQTCPDGGSGGTSTGCASDADCAAGMTCMNHVCGSKDPGPVDGGTPPPQCTSNAQCPPGYSCASGVCQPISCTNDAGCPSGTSCMGGHCEPGPSTNCAPGTICPDGSTCTADGKCGGTSTGGCTSDAQCGPRAICQAGGTCMPVECSPSFPCAGGAACVDYKCQAVGADGGTTGGCTSDAQCGTRAICQNGSCLPVECSPSFPCPGGATCVSYKCQPVMDGGSAGGCASDADCGPNAICQAGSCMPVQCSATLPCPTGLTCVNFKCQQSSVDGGTSTQCAPGTTCPDGTICSSTGTCGGAPTRPVGAPCSQTMPCGGTEQCLQVTSTQAYCTIPCLDSATCSPYGMTCGSVQGKQVCVRPTPCGTDADCPSGTTCQAGMCK